MGIDAIFLSKLICPVSQGKLRYHATTNELISKEAGLAYPIRDGVYILMQEEARILTQSELEQLI